MAVTNIYIIRKDLLIHKWIHKTRSLDFGILDRVLEVWWLIRQAAPNLPASLLSQVATSVLNRFRNQQPKIDNDDEAAIAVDAEKEDMFPDSVLVSVNQADSIPK